ncbi:DUF1304 domain-containing protein [Arthrobacter sp. CAN_A1]|uniref:DUF1304 domain-containing protein n=1 Tax=Arthrobacter sp. CAN_A1 TaxID=2787717 RepID=UPI001A1F66AB
MMVPALPLLTVLFGVTAGLIHVYIFVLESLRWRHRAVWSRFGVRSAGDAETLRPMAFNQGFYNLFLAIGALLGVVLAVTGDGSVRAVGYGMLLLALASMLLAALVLILSNHRLAVAAAIQGGAPAVALASLLLPG